MEIPDKTWQHILALLSECNAYTNYGKYTGASEKILDLLRVVAQDAERETNDSKRL